MEKCYYVASRILHFFFWTDKYTPAFIMLVLRRVNLIVIVIVIFKAGLIVIVIKIIFFSKNNSNSNNNKILELLCISDSPSTHSFRSQSRNQWSGAFRAPFAASPQHQAVASWVSWWETARSTFWTCTRQHSRASVGLRCCYRRDSTSWCRPCCSWPVGIWQWCRLSGPVELCLRLVCLWVWALAVWLVCYWHWRLDWRVVGPIGRRDRSDQSANGPV